MKRIKLNKIDSKGACGTLKDGDFGREAVTEAVAVIILLSARVW